MNAITPNRTRLGVYLQRLQKQANGIAPRKSVGVLTSYTTEGVVRRAKKVEENFGGSNNVVPRWG